MFSYNNRFSIRKQILAVTITMVVVFSAVNFFNYYQVNEI
jgi:hypothetical protein